MRNREEQRKRSTPWKRWPFVLLGFCTLATAQADESPHARWEKAIQAMEKRDRDTPPVKGGLFFCGSSSIVRWDLKKHFGDLKAVNRGFGGSRIADSTYFAGRIILPYEPATLVFYAGDNDIAGGRSPEQVRDDFQAFVKTIHDKLPRTRILFLAIKPSVARWKKWETMARANKLVEAWCKTDARLGYIDVATPMLDKEGKPRSDLFVKDGLHLSEAGYTLWSKVVRPRLTGKE